MIIFLKSLILYHRDDSAQSIQEATDVENEMQAQQEFLTLVNQSYELPNKRRRVAFGETGMELSNAAITPEFIRSGRNEETWTGEYAGWKPVEQFGLSQRFGFPSEAEFGTAGQSSQAFYPSRDWQQLSNRESLSYMEPQFGLFRPNPVPAFETPTTSRSQPITPLFPTGLAPLNIPAPQITLNESSDTVLSPLNPFRNEPSLEGKFEWTIDQKKWLLDYRYRQYKDVFETFAPSFLTRQWNALLSEFQREFGVKVTKTQVTSQLQNMKKRYKLGLKRLEEGRNDLPPNWSLYQKYFESMEIDKADLVNKPAAKPSKGSTKTEKRPLMLKPAPVVIERPEAPSQEPATSIERPTKLRKIHQPNEDDRGRSGTSIQKWKLILLDLYFRKYRTKFQSTEVGQKSLVWHELFADLTDQAGEIGIAMTGRNLQAHICNLRKKYEEGVDAKQKGKAVPRDWELIKEFFEEEKRGVMNKGRERAEKPRVLVKREKVEPQRDESELEENPKSDEGTERLDALIEVALSELVSPNSQ